MTSLTAMLSGGGALLAAVSWLGADWTLNSASLHHPRVWMGQWMAATVLGGLSWLVFEGMQLNRQSLSGGVWLLILILLYGGITLAGQAYLRQEDSTLPWWEWRMGIQVTLVSGIQLLWGGSLGLY